MRLWTLQGIEIYEQLQREGVAYCNQPSWADEPQTLRAYHWMADQMRQRIGEPPIKGIEYPLWAWYQYISAKSNKPPRSVLDTPEGLSAFMEIEMPENEVLLSDFSSWHSVLNEGPIDDWKRIWRQMERLEKEAGRKVTFDEYPHELQKEMEKSWEGVFDLDKWKKEKHYRHRRNLSIQATFWLLKSEHIVSVDFLEKKGNTIKQIKWPNK